MLNVLGDSFIVYLKMKVRKENCEWLKNILLPTKKASKVNKDILYRQQGKKEKKKVFFKF